MPPNDSKVAILFFSRSAEAEGAHKEFACGSNRSKNIEVARSLIEHTRDQIKSTDLPVYEINEKHQHGSSFGERFANAFSGIFEKGYEYVIAVGNDTPELTRKHLKRTRQLLTEGETQIVLGPAEDGGAWLMGYHRKAFELRSFQELPWNSPRLFQSIIEQAGDEIAISKLDSFTDIDNYKALVNFVNQYSSGSSLVILIRQLLDIISVNPVECNLISLHFPSSSPRSSQYLRAPPTFV